MAKKKTETPNGEIEKLVNEMNEEFGGGVIENAKDFISTGSTLLDYAISNRRNGGIPIGRIVDFNGLPGAGKSLLASHIIANTQKKGGIGILMDTERAATEEFMTAIGVNRKKMVYKNPPSIEDAFETIESVMKKTREAFPDKNVPVTIVWDSLAATPPRAELEGEYDPNSQMGIGAKAVAKGLRMLTGDVCAEYVTLVIINQLRDNMKMANPFSDPYVTPYGKSLPYFSSATVRLSKAGNIKLEKGAAEVVGVSCNAKVTKTRHGPGNRVIEFPILYESGIDDDMSIYDYLVGFPNVIQGGTSKMIVLNGEEIKLPRNSYKKILAQRPEIRTYFLDELEKIMVKPYKVGDEFYVEPEVEGIQQKEVKE